MISRTDSKGKSLSEAFVNSFGDYPIGYGIGIVVLPISMGWIQEDVFTANIFITLIYASVSFLRIYYLRRIFENLIIDILRKKYPQNTELYLNKRGRYHHFHNIVSTAKEKIQSGDFNNVKSDFEEVILWVEKLRNEGGKSAHSITFDFLKGDIDKIKNDTNRKLNLLYHRVFSMMN